MSEKLINFGSYVAELDKELRELNKQKRFESDPMKVIELEAKIDVTEKHRKRYMELIIIPMQG